MVSPVTSILSKRNKKPNLTHKYEKNEHQTTFASARRVCSLPLPLQSCDDDADKQAQAEYEKQVAAFEGTVDRLNASILCYQSLLSGEIP